MPVCLASIILYIDPIYSVLLSPELKLATLVVLFVNTAILPLGLLVFLVKKGVIAHYNVPDAKERRFPLFVSILLYLVTIYFFRKPEIPTVLESMLLSVLVGLIAAMIINHFWKISLHLMGIGGVLGGLIALSVVNHFFLPGLCSFFILLAGLIAAARLRLNIHTPEQLIGGFSMGFVLSYTFIAQGFVLAF